MDYYADLLACYLSGQIEPVQWEEHLQDKDFVAWLDARGQ
jgi:hypothetical protein